MYQDELPESQRVCENCGIAACSASYNDTGCDRDQMQAEYYDGE